MLKVARKDADVVKRQVVIHQDPKSFDDGAADDPVRVGLDVD